VKFSYLSHPSRRISIINGLMVLFGIIMAGRLFSVQVVKHDEYLVEAAQQQSRKFVVPAARGQIYLLDGERRTPLALNLTLETLYVDPAVVKNKTKVANALAKVTGDRVEKYISALEQPGDYVVLKRGLPVSVGDKIRELNLLGVGLTQVPQRTYPEGQLGSQLLGFVNADGLGQYGIEGYLDKQLSGKPGLLNFRTDTQGNPIAIAGSFIKPAVSGQGFVLNIDRNIQAEAERIIKAGVENAKAVSGSVVVVDPNTGAVKAMANYPTYDPNSYGKVNNYDVFRNDVVSNQFEPGSGFKVITMAAGLDSKKVNFESTYSDPGSVKIDGATIYNAEKKKYAEPQTMLQVIQKSLNTGVIYVLKAMGGDPQNITMVGKQLFAGYIKKFGFGVATGIEQSGEEAGTVNAPSNVSGNNINYANMTFGQGVSVTMIQMVMAVAAIANGGKLYQPQLIHQIILPDGSVENILPKVANQQVVSGTAASALTKMMVAVVEHGSGYAARVNGYQVAGKTGTAQIPLPGGGYDPTKNIGSFVGFAPANKPRFALMVRINQPQTNAFAETTTVPAFGALTRWLLNYYQVPPG
jgi:cell division protein FtsI/penicillin-binding protein 2